MTSHDVPAGSLPIQWGPVHDIPSLEEGISRLRRWSLGIAVLIPAGFIVVPMIRNQPARWEQTAMAAVFFLGLYTIAHRLLSSRALQLQRSQYSEVGLRVIARDGSAKGEIRWDDRPTVLLDGVVILFRLSDIEIPVHLGCLTKELTHGVLYERLRRLAGSGRSSP